MRRSDSVRFCLLVLLSLAPASHAANRSVNNDIVVTSYETVIMEQGKSKVLPVFQVKNTGQRTYTNVVLAYEAPQAEGGRKASLQLHRPYWDSFTLRAGEEIALNPSSNEGNAYLSASTSQPTVIYSTFYHLRTRKEINDPPKGYDES